jgi:hypothetical protein
MHPLSVLLVLVTAGAGAVHGHPTAAGTPASRFWEEALQGTPMPEAIADLVQQGSTAELLVIYVKRIASAPCLFVTLPSRDYKSA